MICVSFSVFILVDNDFSIFCDENRESETQVGTFESSNSKPHSGFQKRREKQIKI